MNTWGDPPLLPYTCDFCGYPSSGPRCVICQINVGDRPVTGKHRDMSSIDIEPHDVGLCLGYGECPDCDYERAVKEGRAHRVDDKATHDPKTVSEWTTPSMVAEGWPSIYTCDDCQEE